MDLVTPNSTSSAGFVLHAWVDESVHEQPGLYVLAAAVADPAECDPVRSALRDLVPAGSDRLHWREQDDPARAKVAATVAGCDLTSVVVVGVEMSPRHQERARRQCMTHLLARLHDLGVTQVWLESRTRSLNDKDRHLVDRLRGQRLLPRSLRVDIELPSREPMLWVPDAIAGAVAAARKGGNSEHRAALGALVEEIALPLA
jgi:hypothetical protein